MNILGINAFHGDSSAAIVVNGELIAAVEEERFNRVKHWAGFPARSIQFVMEQAGLSIDDIDHVAVSFDPKANLGRKVAHALWNRPSIDSITDRLQRQKKSQSMRAQVAEACGGTETDLRAKIHQVEHHNAHIACGYLPSPFVHAAVLSVDGMGDFVSTVLAAGNGEAVKKYRQVHYPHSLGYLYNALTIYMGFPNYGDEYKVMGLAPYGEPTYLEQMRKLVYPKGDTFRLNLDYFTHVKNGINMTWENGSPTVGAFHSPALDDLLGPARKKGEEVTTHHENIAASLQRVSEEIIFHMLRRLHRITGDTNLVMVGGCAMNSVANGKVTRETPFEEVFVPVGAADNGTSIGAAYHVWNRVLGKRRSFRLKHGYLGDSFDNVACAEAVARNVPTKEERENDKSLKLKASITAKAYAEDDLLNHVVDAICDGKVVGWFRGRMEFGARALGNRSILADPRRTDMRDIINLKIKFRERFRPFAPSILEEHVHDYFEIDEASPFMERVLPIRVERHSEIPAVTHVDGTGRLQSVSKETNPCYWELINRFYERTGTPILLNTSLNENEPIVHTPDEAIQCFLRTSMDLIVVCNTVLERVPHDRSVRIDAPVSVPINSGMDASSQPSRSM